MTVVEDSPIELLVLRTAGGDAAAWQELWQTIEPLLLRMVGQPSFLGRVGQREDDRRNIVVEVMGRLRADGFRRLQSYLDTRKANPNLKFTTWLRVVTKRVGVDYLRGHGQYVDRRHEANPSTPGVWIEPGTMPSQSKLPGERPPMTDRGTAQQLLRYAAGSVPDEQRRALEMWCQSESYEAIARAIGVATASEAERAVRAAIERLRRKFREEGKP